MPECAIVSWVARDEGYVLDRVDTRGTISWVLLPSLPLRLMPGQRDDGAEIATWTI